MAEILQFPRGVVVIKFDQVAKGLIFASASPEILLKAVLELIFEYQKLRIAELVNIRKLHVDQFRTLLFQYIQGRIHYLIDRGVLPPIITCHADTRSRQAVEF